MPISQIIRVSTNSNGEAGNGHGILPNARQIFSDDDRYVLFLSTSTNLTANDTRGGVFVKDLQTGELRLVSTDSAGNSGNQDSFEESISGDGRYVVFLSGASNLVPGDTNSSNILDVFVKDLETGTTTIVSSGPNGQPANLSSLGASISSDGRYVAFESGANNLVPGDSNNHTDIFLRDLLSGALALVSTDASGHQGNGDSQDVTLSADGRHVAFDSRATNLVPGTNGSLQPYVKDLDTGAVTLVAVNANGTPANGFSGHPSISAVGTYVAFVSSATNLVAGDTNNSDDVFVRDLDTGAITRVSTAANGGEAHGRSSSPNISADGRYVVFTSTASDLVPGDTAQSDIFIKDVHTGAIARLSLDTNGSFFGLVSPDGFAIGIDTFDSLVPGDGGGTRDVYAIPNPLLNTIPVLRTFADPAPWTSDEPTSDRGWQVGDFNGDGTDDLFRFVPGQSGADVYLSNGTSFQHDQSWTAAGDGSDNTWTVGDFNGDGRSDIFRYLEGSSGADVFLSNGSEFVHDGSWTGASNGTQGWYVGDFNGDGRADIFRYSPNASAVEVFLSNGSAFAPAGTWTPAGSGSDDRWYVGDFNGDGRSDILRFLTGPNRADVFLSNGTSFVHDANWAVAALGSDGRWVVGDFNGDGRADLMRYVEGVTGADVFLSNGSAFERDQSWTPAGFGSDGKWYVGDFNGDGASDLLRNVIGHGADVLV